MTARCKKKKKKFKAGAESPARIYLTAATFFTTVFSATAATQERVSAGTSSYITLSVNLIAGQNFTSVNLISRLRKVQLLIGPSVHHFSHILHDRVCHRALPSRVLAPVHRSNPGLHISPSQSTALILCAHYSVMFVSF